MCFKYALCSCKHCQGVFALCLRDKFLCFTVHLVIWALIVKGRFPTFLLFFVIFLLQANCFRVQVSRSATTDALRQSPPPRKKKKPKKTRGGDFRLLSSPSILISTLCDSLGFRGILGDTQVRRRLPIKEGGRDETSGKVMGDKAREGEEGHGW